MTEPTERDWEEVTKILSIHKDYLGPPCDYCVKRLASAIARAREEGHIEGRWSTVCDHHQVMSETPKCWYCVREEEAKRVRRKERERAAKTVRGQMEAGVTSYRQIMNAILSPDDEGEQPYFDHAEVHGTSEKKPPVAWRCDKCRMFTEKKVDGHLCERLFAWVPCRGTLRPLVGETMPEMTREEARRIVLQMIKTREAEDASEYDKQCATALRVLLRRVGELEGVVRRVDEALDGCVSAMSGWTVEHLNGNEVIVVPGGERQFREDFDTAIDAQEMCKKALSAAVEEKS